MELLKSLREEQRSPRLYRLRFESAALELEFRDWQRRRHTVARVALFVVLGLAFALTAVFDEGLFAVPADSVATLRALQLGLLLPMTAIGAVISYIDISPRHQRTVQTIAVSGIWSGVLVIRALALHDGFNVPALFFSIVVIAVAFFGGFTWYRIVSGVAIFTFAGVIVEYTQQHAAFDAGLQTYGLLWMALIAAAGSYTHELLSRLAWLNWRYAKVLAATDGLTGLLNHYEFHRLFQRVLAQGAREERKIAVTLLDLDHFKSINDRYGHLFGDRVLREIGALLNREFAQRPLDLRARYGGEEMAIVWYDIQPEALPAMMEGVLDAIRNLPFVDPASDTRVRVTASAGLCWVQADENTATEKVLHAADLLLYGAKADGRNRARLAPFADCLPASELPLPAAIAAQKKLLQG
ncbi:GGDEF domain-containing protein [Solimonas terrae]|uniref:diguanylate cyclase n=1 Tax=Solimonas terrae TaxID=1396819 RepID=A0A6M2BV12_9GAMM|nr:GGDEF domain-containing protein [Solimonas terrae]NGY06328.1 GGDEF domain-containing protein [Solimonas terrae]